MMMLTAPTGNPVHVPVFGDVGRGDAYGVPGGWGIVYRFYTDEEWAQITATWDAWARPQGSVS